MFKRLKDLFIPHEDNGYKPDFLERVSVGIMFGLVLLSFTLANIQALLWMGSDWMVSTILPAVIVDLTNEERGGESLGALRRNSVLDQAAQLKADDMAKNEYFAHYSPAGVSPWHWFDEAKYSYIHAGENLAVHFTDSDEVVNAWMNSPAHRANIMNGNYREIGIGTAKGEYKGFPTIFVVQLFGTPAQVASVPQAPAQQIAGANTPTPSPISVETVRSGGEGNASEPSVSPATIETTESVPVEEEPTQPVSELPAPVDTVTPPVPTESVVIYSDLATSSRPGIPAATEVTPPQSGPETSLLERSGTQSSILLQIVYGFLASIVVVALILSIVIEWRRQHPVQIAYAGGLLAVMALLFYVHTSLTHGVTII